MLIFLVVGCFVFFGLLFCLLFSCYRCLLSDEVIGRDWSVVIWRGFEGLAWVRAV